MATDHPAAVCRLLALAKSFLRGCELPDGMGLALTYCLVVDKLAEMGTRELSKLRRDLERREEIVRAVLNVRKRQERDERAARDDDKKAEQNEE